MLAIDYQHVQIIQKQDRIHLLDQLCHLSAVVREVREQRHDLFEQQQLLHEQLQALYAQKRVLHEQEARALQEYSTILGQLASLREPGFSPNFDQAVRPAKHIDTSPTGVCLSTISQGA